MFTCLVIQMVKGGIDSKLVTRLEKLEQSLFGGKIEEIFSKDRPSMDLFDDELEKAIFMIALDLALEGKVGVTSAFLSEMTKKTKNTVNVRLERLFYKRMLQRQQIGNALLYYVPLQELLLDAITKELISLRKELDESLEGIPKESMEKELLSKYLTNANLILARSKDYFASIAGDMNIAASNLKEELAD